METQRQDTKFKIETIVTLLKGATEAECDLKNKMLSVIYDPKQIQGDMIQFAVQFLLVMLPQNGMKKEANLLKQNLWIPKGTLQLDKISFLCLSLTNKSKLMLGFFL